MTSETTASPQPTPVYVLDVGHPVPDPPAQLGDAPEARLGWARVPQRADGIDQAMQGSLGSLAEAVSVDLRAGQVALGFEAPCWIPGRDEPERLLSARSEADRIPNGGTSAWCGRVAIWSLVRMLPEALWLLRRIRAAIGGSDGMATTRLSTWSRERPLFLFEAAVMGSAHAEGPSEHVQDALTAATVMARWLEGSETTSAVHPTPATDRDGQPLSLLAAAGLGAGLTGMADEINDAPVLVRPNAPSE